MTTFTAPLIKQRWICLSSGKYVFVISTWCGARAIGRSRTDGMGDGVPPHSVFPTVRGPGGAPRGYCQEPRTGRDGYL